MLKKSLLFVVAAVTCLPAAATFSVADKTSLAKKVQIHFEQAKMLAGKAAIWLTGAAVAGSSIFRKGKVFNPKPIDETIANLQGSVVRAIAMNPQAVEQLMASSAEMQEQGVPQVPDDIRSLSMRAQQAWQMYQGNAHGENDGNPLSNPIVKAALESVKQDTMPKEPLYSRAAHYTSIGAAGLGLAYLVFAAKEYYSMCSANEQLLKVEAQESATQN